MNYKFIILTETEKNIHIICTIIIEIFTKGYIKNFKDTISNT